MKKIKVNSPMQQVNATKGLPNWLVYQFLNLKYETFDQ